MNEAMKRIRDELVSYALSHTNKDSGTVEHYLKYGFDKCYEIMSARELRLVEVLKKYKNMSTSIGECVYSAKEALAELEIE